MRAILTAALVAATTIAAPAVAIPPPLRFNTLPYQVDFGAQTALMQSAPVSVQVWNGLATRQTITAVTATAPFQVLSHDCGALDYTQSCSVQLAVTPGVPAAGPITGQLSVETDSGPFRLIPLSVLPSRSMARHFYKSILQREPEAGAAEYWASQVQSFTSQGAGPNEAHYVMAGFFFNSAEYTSAGKSDAAFVQDLYTTFMNRTADAPGLVYWTGQLSAGLPREMLLVAFMFSPEWEAFSAPIVGSGTQRPESDMTMDLYRGLLGRVPDSVDFGYWRGALRQAQCVGPAAVRAAIDSIATSFLASAEYSNRARDNAHFVADLYYAFMRRGADLGGFDFWVDKLGRGTLTRDDVRRAFLATPEFEGRLQKVIDAGCAP